MERKKEKKRVHTFWSQFNEKPGGVPGCLGVSSSLLQNQEMQRSRCFYNNIQKTQILSLRNALAFSGLSGAATAGELLPGHPGHHSRGPAAHSVPVHQPGGPLP